MVAQNLRPAAMVEGEGLQALMKYVEPGYNVRQKHEVWKQSLKKRLQLEMTKFAVTSDIHVHVWTSCAHAGHLHLYFSSFYYHQLADGFLATSPFPDHRMAINIVDKLKQIMSSHGVKVDKGCLIALVHDQGLNMQLHVTDEICEEEIDCESMSCASTLSPALCWERSVHYCDITSCWCCKKLVGHFRHSALDTCELQKQQEEWEYYQRSYKTGLSYSLKQHLLHDKKLTWEQLVACDNCSVWWECDKAPISLSAPDFR